MSFLTRWVLPLSLLAAYADCLRTMWQRWFPAWDRHDLGLYDRLVEGESYYTHGPLILVVSALIATLLARGTRVPVRPRRGLGSAILAAALLVHLFGALSRVNFLSAMTIPVAVAGLCLMLWGGAALRRLWFPIALLVFMAPLPEVTIADINFRLKMIASDLGVRLANFFGVVAVRSGNLAHLSGGKTLVIANVCNGLRTLISLLAFAALYVYLCRLRGAWRLALLACSVPVAVGANAARVATLIVIADMAGVPAATGKLHDLSGLLVFVLALGMMFGLEKLLIRLQRLLGVYRAAPPLFHDVRRTPADAGQWPALRGALSGRAALCASGLLALTAGGVWYLQAQQPAAGLAAELAGALPRELNVGGLRLRGHDMSLDERTLTILESPEYLYRRYADPAGRCPPIDSCLIFARDNRKAIHPPDLCLEGGRQNILAKADVVIPSAGRGIPCRELFVEADGAVYYFLYTYRCGGEYSRSFWRQQISSLLNRLLHREGRSALVRVSTRIVPSEVEAARARAAAVLAEVARSIERQMP